MGLRWRRRPTANGARTGGTAADRRPGEAAPARRRGHWAGPRLLALVALLVLVVLRAVDPAPLRVLRTRTFDIYQQIKPRAVVSRPVTIVDIDERSLATLGQWPWPRTLIAELITTVFEQGATLVAFDIVFAEPDRTSPGRVAKATPNLDPYTRARLRALPSNSAVLAEAMALGPVVVGQGVIPAYHEDYRGPVATPSVALIGQDPRPWMRHYGPVLANVPEIDAAAAGRGVFVVEGEDDGMVRRVPMVINAAGTLWPSLSTEILRVATGNTTIGIRARAPSGDAAAAGRGIEGLIVRPHFIPTDELGRLWVYFSHHDPDKYLSAVDVLEGRFDPDRIAGRLVILGTSAVGLLDIKTTPVDTFLPGVEVHAQVIEALVDGATLTRPRLTDAGELALAFGFGLVMIVLVPLLGATWTLGLLVVGMGGAFAGSWVAFADYRLLTDPVFPSFVALVMYIGLNYANHAREEAEKRRVRAAFSHYMAPAMVERLVADPSRLRLGGEMRELTLMFCDIRGFTTLSEQFDAEGLTRLINGFLTPMTEVILSHQGTIDKYMGDCIMAFWNAPLDDPDHALHATQAALAMLAALEDLNGRLEREAAEENRPFLPIRIGIGLNTGEVCVGNMGSEQRFDYSVLGDDVNLASRLEGQCKTYGVPLVVGERTAAALAGRMPLLELDQIQVKGKTRPVRVFTVLDDEAAPDAPDVRALIGAQETLLNAYRCRDWDAAEAALADCRRLAGPRAVDLRSLHDLYATRVAAFRAAPPGDDWDGVFVMREK
ncbi:CHASE2 domain-containing protein [Roseospira visakhapatnamensis]|uniref:Adenylate cyclase n=1 Tax=Roseospira visakhapatnamensis TaxID=390880 RepID=A0A7W6WAX4_9PROT|nr:adenylate/guanylate cyclase domain-containing protein [Roseospira visakhapatnamensis]MBB4267258.1 adenylate cyclase [Roseospira visakhapatnamensis]